jgi:hypothetical protein
MCEARAQDAVVFQEAGQVTRNASFLWYPSRSKNNLSLVSAARNILNLIDLKSCPANLILPAFGNTTVSLADRFVIHARSKRGGLN